MSRDQHVLITILKSLFPEQMGKSPLVLVCNIRDIGHTKFVQMVIIGSPRHCKKNFD